jgi:hypothetical protein
MQHLTYQDGLVKSPAFGGNGGGRFDDRETVPRQHAGVPMIIRGFKVSNVLEEINMNLTTYHNMYAA